MCSVKYRGQTENIHTIVFRPEYTPAVLARRVPLTQRERAYFIEVYERLNTYYNTMLTVITLYPVQESTQRKTRKVRDATRPRKIFEYYLHYELGIYRTSRSIYRGYQH